MELITRAFVIRREESGEYDAALGLYTKDLGKILGRVRGYRKLSSKLRPGLLPFSESWVTLYPGKGGWLVIGAETIDGHKHIAQHRLAVHVAFIVVDLLENLAPPEERDEALFAVIDAFFRKLSEGAYANKERGFFFLEAARFLGALSFFLGVLPEVTRCVSCGRGDITLEQVSINGGGMVCGACAVKSGDLEHIGARGARCFQAIFAVDIASGADGSRFDACGPSFGRASPSVEEAEIIFLILVRFLRFHAPR